ncbi:MAG: hypothetical protein ABL888_16195 [Pirellulaceae bacterium]
MTISETVNAKRSSIAIAITISALVLLVAKVALHSRYPALKFDDITTLGLLVVAAIPWIATLIESLRVGDVEVRFKGIEEEQDAQADILANQHDVLLQTVRRLSNMIDEMVGQNGRSLLAHLRDKKTYVYEPSADGRDEMRSTLRQLRLLGLISTQHKIHDLIKDTGDPVDLNQELIIEPKGALYLEAPPLEESLKIVPNKAVNRSRR